MRKENYKMMKLEMQALPCFGQQREIVYEVGGQEIKIRIDPKVVFPPSETTMELCESVFGMKADRALDLGTGSGIIAIALAKGGCRNVMALDMNPEAVRYAEYNAKRNYVDHNVKCITQDIYSWDPVQKFDLIVSNSPFMPMPEDSKFISNEIKIAINGGCDGTQALIAFSRKARSLLAENGKFIVGVPQFTNFSKVMSFLSSIYSVKIIREKEIRYWLAEYEPEFKRHILQLSEAGKNVILQNGEFFKATLLIAECR